MQKKVIDQKEYLKKYLSSGNGDDKKKKKKKKMKVGTKTVKIIDDDIDLKNMRPIEENEFDIFINAEEAPQIAGIVDERGPVDFTDKRRWKIIANSEDGDLTITSQDRKNEGFKKSRDDTENDLSPPRRQMRLSNDDLYLPETSNFIRKQKHKGNMREKKDDDSNSSPPRKRFEKHFANESGTETDTLSYNAKRRLRGKEMESDSDLSPPRQMKSYDSDLSPPRRDKYRSEKSVKQKNKSDSDASPPRKSRKGSDSDMSPPRQNKVYDSDLSPPRKSIQHRSKKNREYKNKSDSDLSPPRRYDRQEDNNDDSDLSPPRQNKMYESSSFESKRSRYGDELSLSRKHKHRDSHRSSYKTKKDSKHSNRSYGRDRRFDSDMSPPRRKHRELDESRNRPREGDKDSYKFKKSKWNNRYEYDLQHHSYKESSHKRERYMEDGNKRLKTKHNGNQMKKTLDGKTAGLQDAKALREETEAHKKREAEHFSKLSKDVTGVGQAVVIRDRKTGKKRNLEAEAAEEREKQKRQAELNEKYAKWGKGLKQVEDCEEKLKDDLYEMSKPLARYADDVDLDKRLREQEREGDPMLEYIKQKQIKEGKRKPDKPTYAGSYMPNRFGIKPGHRWDGVDRSNGYEKRWFEAQNAKVARQEEAYKWSTSDM